MYTDHESVRRALRECPEYFADPIELGEPLKGLALGANVVIHANNRIHLLKFDGWETEFLPGNLWRDGHWLIHDGSALLARRDNRPVPRRPLVHRSMFIRTTHRIEFVRDPEFGVYLPSSSGSPFLSIPLTELYDQSVIEQQSHPRIITDEEDIHRTLAAITTPYYFNYAVLPFLENRPTHFKPPHNKDGFHRRAKQLFLGQTRHIPHGGFVYVGCKEEVYLMGLARKDGEPYYQGTYTTSTKPPLFFTNNYLGHFSVIEARKPLFTGSGSCNVAEYRTEDPAGFGGKAFVFPHLVRRQSCKYTMFTGSPEIITGDIHDALWHFRTTDFSDQKALVERYAATIKEVPVGYERCGPYTIPNKPFHIVPISNHSPVAASFPQDRRSMHSASPRSLPPAPQSF